MENRFEGSLKAHGVPLPTDFKDRLRLLDLGLRGKPEFEDELKKFKGNQTGGQDPFFKPDADDFLGPQLRWFVETMGSPYAQMALRTVFAFIFFVSYLEKIPMFGSILSAALDVMVAGGKALTKTIQTNLPPLFGLIPLPWMSLVGLSVAAVFGMIMWPMLAVVSLSRQDFAFAIESFIRVIPPPIGNTVADLFMEGNRMVGRLNEKRRKLGEDVSNAFSAIGDAVSGLSEKASEQIKQGATAVASQAAKVSSSDAVQRAKSLGTGALDKAKGLGTGALEQAKAQVAGKSFSRRVRKKDKWHRRTQRRSVTR